MGGKGHGPLKISFRLSTKISKTWKSEYKSSPKKLTNNSELIDKEEIKRILNK